MDLTSFYTFDLAIQSYFSFVSWHSFALTLTLSYSLKFDAEVFALILKVQLHSPLIMKLAHSVIITITEAPLAQSGSAQ